ncbi:TetR/AcrR family transcriptional regulator, partial [Streptomyces cupreus]
MPGPSSCLRAYCWKLCWVGVGMVAHRRPHRYETRRAPPQDKRGKGGRYLCPWTPARWRLGTEPGPTESAEDRSLPAHGVGVGARASSRVGRMTEAPAQGRGARSRDAILDTAGELMARHGYAATSISMISAACGLPVSSL